MQDLSVLSRHDICYDCTSEGEHARIRIGPSDLTPQLQIATDIHAGQSITWVGTAYLVATTSFQIIYGRLSCVMIICRSLDLLMLVAEIFLDVKRS